MAAIPYVFPFFFFYFLIIALCGGFVGHTGQSLGITIINTLRLCEEHRF